MSLWRHLTRGLRTLTDREASDREIADEVQHFIDEATAELIASGLPPAEARRRAGLEYGAPGAIREQVRSFGWENVVEGFLADLRYAARGLRGRPVFAAASVLTLLFGVSRLDPVTYAGVIALLAVVAAIASAVPARRAARVNPVTTLNAE